MASRGVTCGVGPINSSRCFIIRCHHGTNAFSDNLPRSKLLICHVGPTCAKKGIGCGKAAQLSRMCVFHPNKAAGISKGVRRTTFDTRGNHATFKKDTSLGPFCDSKARTHFTLAGVSSYKRALSFSLMGLKRRLILSRSTIAFHNRINRGVRLAMRTSIS